MYRGVNTGSSSASDFASAVACLALCTKTPTGRTRKAGYDGYPLNRTRGKDAVAKVRELDDGSIAFRLYSTDVVTWHPDNTVTADNWGSVTTSTFANQFLPGGIAFNTTGTIEYATAEMPVHQPWSIGQVYDNTPWREYWNSRRVCQGKQREVTFGLDEHDMWVPTDESQLDPFEVPVLDRKIARAAAKEYNLADFKPWLQLVTYHTELRHEGVDFEACANALRDRKFKEAAVHLPTIEPSRGWGIEDRIKPLRFKDTRWNEHVTMSSLKRVRDYVYDLAGAFSTEKFTTVSRSQLDRIKQRTNELAKAKVYL